MVGQEGTWHTVRKKVGDVSDWLNIRKKGGRGKRRKRKWE